MPADGVVVVVAEPTTSTAAAPVDADGASTEPAAGPAFWVATTRPAAGAWAPFGSVAGAGFAADLPRRVARARPAPETAGLSSTRELARRPDRVGPAVPVETAPDPVAESPGFRDVTACWVWTQMGAATERGVTAAIGSGVYTAWSAAATWLVFEFRASAASRRTACASAKASPKLTSSGPLGTLI
jgi:hypothetical protein